MYTEEIETHCPKCGEDIALVSETYTEDHGEKICEIKEAQCENCGYYVDKEDTNGIKYLLKDGFILDADNYLMDADRVYIKDIYKDIHREAKMEALKFFIKGLRPENFESFCIWSGVKIK